MEILKTLSLTMAWVMLWAYARELGRKKFMVMNAVIAMVWAGALITEIVIWWLKKN